MKALYRAGRGTMGLVAALAVSLPMAATAQKAKDTLRVAVKAAIPTLSDYEFAQQDASFHYRAVYGTLFSYDERKKTYHPRLAKSWKYIDPMTIEFELRDDVTFHNGDKFDADDAVYTTNWSVAPDSKVFIKNRFTGTFKRAEKLGPYKLRLYTAEATPLVQLRMRIFTILDSEVHSKLTDKSEYGRNPIGTGPMRVSAFDPGQKIVLTRFDNYKFDDRYPIGRIETTTIPDGQTQIAQLLTGGIDLVREPSKDQIEEFGTRPGLAATIGGASNLVYIMYDANNRSGSAKPLTDVRVRRALSMAIDRAALVKNLGVKGQDSEPLNALCIDLMQACAYSVNAPSYDVEGAKRLLKEAGYENGFPLEVTTRTGVKEWGEAITGELYKIGIQAKLNAPPETVFRKMNSEGKMQMRVNTSALLTLPDAHLTMQINYVDKSEDYAQDNLLLKLGDDAYSEMDPGKREGIYRNLYNRINEQVYLFPVAVLPTTYLQSADLVYDQTPGYLFTPMLSDFRWR